MFSLITGGSASGKSEYAEQLVTRLPGERIYLATMPSGGAEAAERIAKHRRARAGKGFRTLDRSMDLAGLIPAGESIPSPESSLHGAISCSPVNLLPARANVLLEDLGNLLANEMYGPAGRGPEAALAGIRTLAGCCASLTVVTNEVGAGGTDYAGDTLRYMRELGRLNNLLAAEADLVVEVICGQPNILKGELPAGPEEPSRPVQSNSPEEETICGF